MDSVELNTPLRAPLSEPGELPESRIYHIENFPGKTRDQLREEIAAAYHTGFNALSVPAIVNGYTLFPSETMHTIKLPRQLPLLGGRDALADICAAAKKYGMLMGVSVGLTRTRHFSGKPKGHLIKKHPSLGTRNAAGKLLPFGGQDNSIFLCPTNPDVKRLYGDLVYEIFERYPVRVLILQGDDFPCMGKEREWICYCEHCEKTFIEHAEINLTKSAVQDDESTFQTWRLWRLDTFHRFVRYIKTRMQKARRKSLSLIHTALLSSDDQSPLTALFNELARLNVVNGLVLDIPDDSLTQNVLMDNTLSILPDTVMLIASIPLMPAQKVNQIIKTLRATPVSGIEFGNGYQSSPDHFDVLKDGAFSKKATVVGKNPGVTAQYVIAHLENTLTESRLQALFHDISRFLSVNSGEIDLTSISSIVDNLRSVERQIREKKIELATEKAHRVLLLVRKLKMCLNLLETEQKG